MPKRPLLQRTRPVRRRAAALGLALLSVATVLDSSEAATASDAATPVDGGAKPIDGGAKPVDGGASRPTVRLGWTDTPPVLDGRMDEAAWLAGEAITDMRQVLPVPGFKGSGGECLYAEDLLELFAKCVTFDALGWGDHQGLDLDVVKTTVEGDIDFGGTVGLGPSAAFSAIRIAITLDGDADRKARDRLVSTVRQVSVLGQSLAAVPQEWTLKLAVVA